MGIGIANYVYWCNTCGTSPAPPPPPTTFPLQVGVFNSTGCEAYEMTVKVYRAGALHTTLVATKLSGSLVSTQPTTIVQVYATDTVDVIVEALAPTTVVCQNQYTGSQIQMATGVLGNVTVRSQTQSPTTAPTYTFNPVENVEDYIITTGIPT